MVRPEEVGLSSERLARIRPGIAKHIGEDRLAGAVALLARRGELVHLECIGLMDRESRQPMRSDTIFRIMSMTKPVTCTALLMLYEQGHLQLFDPVSKFIPAFKDLKVSEGQDGSRMRRVDPSREVTVRDLLNHTSGLTYHWLEYGPVEAMYREAKVHSDQTLAAFVNDLAALPLAFHPGTAWRYGFSHDVVAYLVEVLSGQPFDAFLHENLFRPLEMVDTGFYVPSEKLDRFATLYGSSDILLADMTVTRWFEEAMQGINRRLSGPKDSLESAPHRVIRGGHGLVSTAPDYWRFCQMLLNRGELDGVRILGRKTVELMTMNHLPPEMIPFEVGGTYYPGYGYGLGVQVLIDVGQCQSLGTPGEYGWDGAASTYFWIDPQEELIGIQMAQFQPPGLHRMDMDFRVLAYQSIID